MEFVEAAASFGAMAPFEFRVLGPLEVRRDGEPVAIPAPKQRALLGLLLLHANEPVPQDVLIEELWGDSAPPTARASLQNQVHALRKVLGAETLERRAGGYVLNVERGELDLEQFEHLVAEARTAERQEKAAKLRFALALWRGAPLVEFPSAPFAQHEIARLEEERLTVLEARIDVELELGLHRELVPELEELVERYPLRERLWGQLMLALYRAGRQGDALAAYGRSRRTLDHELGIEPGADLRALQRAILVQDSQLDDPEHRPGWTLERAAAILPGDPRERVESLYQYGLALMRTGELQRAVSTLEGAARLAARVGDRGVEDRSRLFVRFLAIWTEGSSVVEYLAEAERSAAEFEERGDLAGLSVALRHQLRLLGPATGRADAATSLALRCAELAVRLGDVREEGDALANWAFNLALGSVPVPDAIAECEELLARDEWEGVWSAPSLPLRLWQALAYLYAQVGRIEEARSLAERAQTRARGASLLPLYLGAHLWQAEVEEILGDLGSALEHTRVAYAEMLPAVALHLGRLLARAGEIAEADELARAARAAAAPGPFHTEVTWRRALALVAAHAGRFEEAVLLSDEARARASASDWLTFRGQLLEEAAFVWRRAGDAVGERDALAEALALYEEKGNLVGAERVRQTLAGSGPRGQTPPPARQQSK